MLASRTAADPGRPPSLDELELDRLEAHFGWVMILLRAQPVEGMRAEQRVARERSLETIEAYARARRFPRNPLADGMAPTFVDHAGTPCAVAHLMLDRGLEPEVGEVRGSMNLAYVADMGDMIDRFATLSGLTAAELALIQPEYCPRSEDTCSYNAYECPGGDLGSSDCSCVTTRQEDGLECFSNVGPLDPCFVHTCSAGRCIEAEPVDCSDGDPATHDACVEDRGCVSVMIDVPPAEGDPTGEPEPDGCSAGSAGFERGSPAAVLAALFLLAVYRRRSRAKSS